MIMVPVSASFIPNGEASGTSQENITRTEREREIRKLQVHAHQHVSSISLASPLIRKVGRTYTTSPLRRVFCGREAQPKVDV